MSAITRINPAKALFLAIIITMASAMVVTAAPDMGCDDLFEYRDETVQGTIPVRYADTIEYTFSDDFSVADASRSEIRASAVALEAWAVELADVPEDDIPPAALPMHEALYETVDFMADLLSDMVGGSAGFNLGEYDERADAIKIMQAEAEEYGYAACGSAWVEVFGMPNQADTL